ncbi:hypothetical protein CDN99_17275 [Roseateles aquatilis]|uniref:DNA-binding protein H-NS-like C-terminal domain-containing protein n=1 Tax=Roseateles aquatilis TaxID=431061 RepID=A0A246J7W8_9BURK|nr:H-NS histone family protein [Roseateles aquatilis]OWQ88595.1 hypothetical protein CDN99_17275 [Roseateles aquatilis]
MAKSLKQVLTQIEKLQKEADALRSKEISGVVARIREAIDHYGLTAEELFGGDGVKAARGGRASMKSATKSAGKRAAKAPRGAGAPKYHDGTGRTWTGVGKRPTWFKDALANGKTAEDLLIPH